MSITFGQAIQVLLNGEKLSWDASGNIHSGSIRLSKPGQRRIFNFLLNENPQKVADGADTLIPRLIAAWNDEDSDTLSEPVKETRMEAEGPWRLHSLEASNFGGLNTYGGSPFRLDLRGETWCLEGSNGSGKTLLASAIIWALTGHRIIENQGLKLEDGVRTPVHDEVGKKIGSWPPIATYPRVADNLTDVARVSVRLEFANPEGVLAQATRTLISSPTRSPEIDVNVDPRLLSDPELVEAGVLMPSRLTHINFDARSDSLYEAIKMLTGFDQLFGISKGAAAFSNRGRRFLKYSNDQNMDRIGQAFGESLKQARELSDEAQLTIPDSIQLGSENILQDLESLGNKASVAAGQSLAILESDVAEGIDLSSSDGRKQLSKAIHAAGEIFDGKFRDLPTFTMWRALTTASKPESLQSLLHRLPEIENRLGSALEWHKRQAADEKFRLKALAAQFFFESDDVDELASCPLCMQHLSSNEQLKLASELAVLKADAEIAERTLDDACSDIEKSIRELLPSDIQVQFEGLATMNPSVDFQSAMKSYLVESTPFSDVLVGIGTTVNRYLVSKSRFLPQFDFHEPEPPLEMRPQAWTELSDFICRVKRVIALVGWWKQHRQTFADTWLSLLARENPEGKLHDESLRGMLEKLQGAYSKAEPLDKLATHLIRAREQATEWNRINSEQKTREAIAQALDPLKNLKQFVDSESHRLVASLAEKVGTILQKIRLRDPPFFQSMDLKNRKVNVQGRFSEEFSIDVALVANSSWLRACLWAFVFAIRDAAVEGKGCCNFPLVVLDDPQLTFDPKNKRKWAEKIADMTNNGGQGGSELQLFLTTHERQFFQILTDTCKLTGQKGTLARPAGSEGIAQVLNGTKLERLLSEAKEAQNDEKGREYVRNVRIYCEDLLRIMLRPESYELTTDTLGALTALLVNYRSQKVAPFDRPVFKKLVDSLNEKAHSAIKLMNAASHTDDRTIGLCQAEEVEQYWNQKLRKQFSDAFTLAADYDAYGGDPKLYSYSSTVVDFPVPSSDEISKAKIFDTGIAAAAASDGLVGSGAICLEEWESSSSFVLHNHHGYRISRPVLEPVATVGDVVLVRSYGQPKALDLVVVAQSEELIARRLNVSQDHEGLAILTGQCSDPSALPEPTLAPMDNLSMRKIVGTVFGASTHGNDTQSSEVELLENDSFAAKILDGVRLFKVSGRSMEPVALDGQYVMTKNESLNDETLSRLDGTLVIAIDEDERKYFKRLHRQDTFIVPESVNSSKLTPSELLSLDGSGRPRLTGLLSVVGVMFETPTTVES